MKTKLTLSIDKELISFAEQQARRKGSSISAMVSDYFRRQQRKTSLQRAVPKVSDMVGSLKNYPIDDSKAAIRELYAKKYLS